MQKRILIEELELHEYKYYYKDKISPVLVILMLLPLSEFCIFIISLSCMLDFLAKKITC
jgi:hypothetical protein